MNRKLLTFLVALFPSLSTAMGTRPTPRQEVETELRRFVDGGGIPGFTAALVTSEGTTYFSYGIDPDSPERKLDENTRFQVASISKLFTTAAMADMVREGLLSLDDPAEKYLPQGTQLPARNGKTITLRTLATHTSGLPTAERGDKERAKAMKLGWKHELETISRVKLPTDPGAKFNYSNMGMALLGHVLEIRDQAPYEKLVVRRVLAPLGMVSTWVTHPAGAESPVFQFEAGIYAPAGGFSSNARDLAKFAAGAVGAAPQPLMKSLELTFTPQGKDSTGRPLHLGWHEEDSPRRLAHTGLAHAYLGIDLDAKVAVVILATAQTTSINPLGSAALATLGGGKGEFPKPRKSVKLTAEVLEKYTGVYRNEPAGGLVTVTSDSNRGILLLAFDGGVKFPMWAEKSDSYYCREWHCDMKFPALVNGQAPSVSLFMDSWTGEYTRTVSGK